MKDFPGTDKWKEQELLYQSRLIFISFEVRILNLLSALLMTVLLGRFGVLSLPRGALYTYIVWLSISAFYLIPFRRPGRKGASFLNRVHFSYYFLGLACATSLVHFLGGAEWIGAVVYFFDLVYANVLMKRLKAAIITALIVLSYISLVAAEYFGIVPHYNIFPVLSDLYHDSSYVLSTNVLIMGMLFLLLAYSTSFFSKIKQQREQQLSDSRNRFMHKALQLETITKQLRKKAAENRYIKGAATGYIEKKEYELEGVRNDLQNRIDNLRRTQKAMFYMIEDLNSMSAQLKDARDHLEEKVRKRSEELLHINRKLHRSERLAFLGKLAGSVTHELRNPLAVLKNAIFFLKNKLTGIGDQKVEHYVEVMEKEIMLIDHIIEDIMGFARTRPVNPEKTDMMYMLENLCGELDLPEEINVVKELSVVPEVKVDPRQITHALVNIANNAIIAMNGKGTLILRTYHSDGCVCVDIKDDGPGIPEKEQDLIFEPLYSSKPKGTGLGLPISRMMIENNNGSISFESEPGKGTVFRVCFPIAP